jgi:general secretion pathway protein D
MSTRYRLGVVGLLGLLLGPVISGAGCATSSLSQARQADDLRDYDTAVAQYTKAVRENPNSKDAQIGLERARLRAAEQHLYQGRRLAGQGRYDEALTDLQIANELNPTSDDVVRELRAVRSAVRARMSAGNGNQTSLESVLTRARDMPVASYDMPTAPLAQIVTGPATTSGALYRLIGRLAGISITFDPQFRETPAPVSLASGMTPKQALDAIAKATATFYQVTGPATITVIPDTAAKRREYTEEVARTFVIQNADLTETVNTLRVVADARYISPMTGTNMVVVRGSPDLVQTLGRFISAFDKARPEVVVDVEILEVNRSQLLEYGLQIATPGQPGINGVADVNRAGLTLQNLRNLSAADVLMGGVPALYYRLIKTDGRTRVLANPHLRVSDGIAATARFGQDVPVPTTTFQPLATGGVNVQPTTSFAYRTIGVNITITPRTHPNEDVTLGLDVELSSLGPPGFDGLPTFGKRNVTTQIRLKDGETNILAGLIRDDERTAKESIPGLGRVPILGDIFARNKKEGEQTDVVVMMTPHIVRVLDLADEDLRAMRIPREGSGAAVIEGPSVPPPPIRGGGGGGGGGIRR